MLVLLYPNDVSTADEVGAVSNDVRELKKYAEKLFETKLTWRREELFGGITRWFATLHDPLCIEDGQDLAYIENKVRVV